MVGSARGMARLVRICLFKLSLVLLNIRGRNGCGRSDGAAVVVVVVVDDGGSVAGSVVGSKYQMENWIILYRSFQDLKDFHSFTCFWFS